MDRRIETRVIETGKVELTTIIQRDACEIYWITVSIKSTEAIGNIKIYDGFDAGGKLQWHLEPITSDTHNFIPPIPCDYGITIWNDANIVSYTVAYRGRGWPREQK